MSERETIMLTLKRIKAAGASYHKFRRFSSALARYEFLRALKNSYYLRNKKESKRYQDLLFDAISKQIPDTIEKYKSTTWTDGTPHDGVAPIWICRLDGPEKLPAITSRCIRSVCDHAGQHPVKYIDFYNIDKYVSLPKYIIDLRDQGIIPLANFCDILRLALLYEHGGLWLDSDLFVSRDIPDAFFSKPFITEKNDYQDIYQGESLRYLSQGNWTPQVIGGWKGNTLFKYALDAHFEYWQKNDTLIDHLFIDYILEIARRTFPNVKEAFEVGAVHNGRYRKLSRAFNDALPKTELSQIIPKDIVFNTLNWKGKYPSLTADGYEAVFCAFLESPKADIEYLKKCR